MDEKYLRKLLKEFKVGRKDAEAVLAELKSLFYRKPHSAQPDMRRETAKLLNISGFEKECHPGLEKIKRGKGKILIS